ncbi:protein-methionine-sulfoxide reductase heme-binding subunit MsrQ [Denitromonas ohlonensis]|uniref:Protein-methionine-sulfoxide reductase heme-binding subunit MsrQ n=2 Tax=Denitromonas TaxID=139331 RepID=A0A557RD14_9RHOO|nr:protein-methionine-sulfoxide reductase heme-binding subunit MsrQ [Denitromonas ohlonensis]TVO63038.1 sulfoxide reductase heme-binding subunit YedZ [Denitromonas ohlonensis]TVO73710.1 sulfoxide reductase heme-binding subunit YedZ [Denitromonas ohlonensis]
MTATPAPRSPSIKALSPQKISALKVLVFILSLIPLGLLLLAFFQDELGANPIETITHATGDWTLRFLLITLAVTPLRKLTGWHWLLRLRRMLGLFTFFYAVLHFGTYIVLDQFFDWRAVVLDVLKRPYITVGFAAFVLLVPLAVTSTNAMVRRLGGRRWQALHRSVYGIAILGVVHYWWLVKADVFAPLIYALILAVLLGLRAWWREQERRRQRAAPPPSATGRSQGRIIPILPQ